MESYKACIPAILKLSPLESIKDITVSRLKSFQFHEPDLHFGTIKAEVVEPVRHYRQEVWKRKRYLYHLFR